MYDSTHEVSEGGSRLHSRVEYSTDGTVSLVELQAGEGAHGRLC